MSQDKTTGTIDPGLAAWVREEANLTEGTTLGSDTDRALLALLKDAAQSPPPEMSHAEITRTLVGVRTRVAREESKPFGRSAAWLSVAAVLFGVALGLTILFNRSAPSSAPGTATPHSEVIKQVSFESIHEGKVVSFQLELSRVR